MTDLEKRPLLITDSDECISEENKKPSTNLVVLWLTNFTTYWTVQTLLSVVLVTGYAIASIVMEHNVCRFDKAEYVDDPMLPAYDDPD